MAMLKYKNGSSWVALGGTGTHKLTFATTGTVTANAGTAASNPTVTVSKTTTGTSVKPTFTFNNLKGKTGGAGSTGATGESANCYAYYKVKYGSALSLHQNTVHVWNANSMVLKMTALDKSYTTIKPSGSGAITHGTSYGYLHPAKAGIFGVYGTILLSGCKTSSQSTSGTYNQGIIAGVVKGNSAGSATSLVTGSAPTNGSDYAFDNIFASISNYNSINISEFLVEATSSSLPYFYLAGRYSSISKTNTDDTGAGPKTVAASTSLSMKCYSL